MLPQVADVAEAKQLLDQCNMLEHGITVRELGGESAIAASTLQVRAARLLGEAVPARRRFTL